MPVETPQTTLNSSAVFTDVEDEGSGIGLVLTIVATLLAIMTLLQIQRILRKKKNTALTQERGTHRGRDRLLPQTAFKCFSEADPQHESGVYDPEVYQSSSRADVIDGVHLMQSKCIQFPEATNTNMQHEVEDHKHSGHCAYVHCINCGHKYEIMDYSPHEDCLMAEKKLLFPSIPLASSIDSGLQEIGLTRACFPTTAENNNLEIVHSTENSINSFTSAHSLEVSHQTIHNSFLTTISPQLLPQTTSIGLTNEHSIQDLSSQTPHGGSQHYHFAEVSPQTFRKISQSMDAGVASTPGRFVCSYSEYSPGDYHSIIHPFKEVPQQCDSPCAKSSALNYIPHLSSTQSLDDIPNLNIPNNQSNSTLAVKFSFIKDTQKRHGLNPHCQSLPLLPQSSDIGTQGACHTRRIPRILLPVIMQSNSNLLTERFSQDDTTDYTRRGRALSQCDDTTDSNISIVNELGTEEVYPGDCREYFTADVEDSHTVNVYGEEFHTENSNRDRFHQNPMSHDVSLTGPQRHESGYDQTYHRGSWLSVLTESNIKCGFGVRTASEGCMPSGSFHSVPGRIHTQKVMTLHPDKDDGNQSKAVLHSGLEGHKYAIISDVTRASSCCVFPSHKESSTDVSFKKASSDDTKLHSDHQCAQLNPTIGAYLPLSCVNESPQYRYSGPSQRPESMSCLSQDSLDHVLDSAHYFMEWSMIPVCNDMATTSASGSSTFSSEDDRGSWVEYFYNWFMM